MIHTATRIVREAMPGTDIVLRAAIRAGVGLALISAGPLIMDPVWSAFGGKFLVMMAIVTLVGHSEGVVVSHLASKLRSSAGAVFIQVLFIPAAVLMMLCIKEDKTPYSSD